MGIDVGGNSHDGIYPKRSKREVVKGFILFVVFVNLFTVYICNYLY